MYSEGDCAEHCEEIQIPPWLPPNISCLRSLLSLPLIIPPCICQSHLRLSAQPEDRSLDLCTGLLLPSHQLLTSTAPGSGAPQVRVRLTLAGERVCGPWAAAKASQNEREPCPDPHKAHSLSISRQPSPHGPRPDPSSLTIHRLVEEHPLPGAEPLEVPRPSP